MLSCFIDHVGLIRRPGVYDHAPSGEYMNTLPGISLKSVDDIADEEQRTFARVWEDVQHEAAHRFYLDIRNEMRKCFKLDPDCDYKAMICVAANKELLTSAWKYLLGVQLMHERIHSPRLNRLTIVDAKKAVELRDQYQTEYLVYLEQAVQLMDTSDCELCCGGNPQTVTYRP